MNLAALKEIIFMSYKTLEIWILANELVHEIHEMHSPQMTRQKIIWRIYTTPNLFKTMRNTIACMKKLRRWERKYGITTIRSKKTINPVYELAPQVRV